MSIQGSTRLVGSATVEELSCSERELSLILTFPKSIEVADGEHQVSCPGSLALHECGSLRPDDFILSSPRHSYELI